MTATQGAISCAVGTTPLEGVHRSGMVNTNPASPSVSGSASAVAREHRDAAPGWRREPVARC